MDAWYVPALPVGGETVTVVLTDPVPEPGGFSVANVGRAAVSVIIAPGTPAAWTGTDVTAPPATVTSAIGSITRVGGLPTRMCVTEVPDSALAAVHCTSYSPASPAPGVHWNIPDVFEAFVVNDDPAGRPEAFRDVMAFPSGSLAVTVKPRAEPAVISFSGGATTCGAWSEPAGFTVI